ncbi:Hsp70 family protein [Asanoa sp. WMMD1127]|uniref:Hsp70 family protein n=1 Tax=Asanoa sp. WMMD1127 TaxID=3016107 RepID=UPI002415BC94|nr:Hsp70 family protein [Asanoa sp. WMMD1127]MDG4822726.1 Hsp70 family protein [Asanoa sp. WMMD1127]
MYALGVDLGTTFTAAATWRTGHAEIASLGSRAAAVPSVVLLREDETFLTGEPANRRGLTEPHRVAREFKRRFGDTTPILLGGVPYSAEALMGRLLRWTLDEVASREGGAPRAITVSHPANWGPYKTDLLRQAVRLSGIEEPVSFITEPEAAAVFYASQQRIDPGAVVAVYDLGGGTFDAAVLRKTAQGFEILGQPEGIERLGGIDFDAAVFHHVAQALGGKLAELDEDDPTAIAAVARLREECVAAKEALSADTDVSIPVLLPTISTEIRLTRGELEAMVRPALYGSIEALRRAVRSAGVEPEQLHSVLLVGGSSRMPIVAQLVAAELNRPVAVDAHPKHAVALGAARLAGAGLTGQAPDAGAARGSATVVIHHPPTRATGSAPVSAPPMSNAPVSPTPMPSAPVSPSPARPTSGPPARPTSAPPARAAAAPPTGRPTSGAPVRPASAPPAQPHRSPVTAPADEPTARMPQQVFAPGRAGSAAPTSPAPRPHRVEYAYPAAPSQAPPRPRNRALLVTAAVVVVLALAGAALWVNRDNFGFGSADPTNPTNAAGVTAPPLPPDEQCTAAIQANERWVCITQAFVDDEKFVVEYDAQWKGAAPRNSGGFHLHIYGGDGQNPPAAQMGNQSDQPGRFYLEDKEPSVRAVDGSNYRDVIGDNPKVCARIADAADVLVKDTEGGYETGNCVTIQDRR